MLILCSQREQILPLSRLDVKIFRGYCPSYKFTNFKVDLYELIQVICLAAEDVTQGTTSQFPSDRLRTSVVRQVTELCLYSRKFLPVRSRGPILPSVVLLCSYFCGTTCTRLCGAVAYYVTWKTLCSVGWGGGVSSGHKCKISIKRPPPLLFRELRCKKGGRIIEQIGTMIDHFPEIHYWAGVSEPHTCDFNHRLCFNMAHFLLIIIWRYSSTWDRHWPVWWVPGEYQLGQHATG